MERTVNTQLQPIIRMHQYHEHPKVTAIIPVYKVERYLPMCILSVLNQTMEELEVIIVDEGDQDRCREIIDYFEKHDPRVIAPHQKNGGYGASCNLGISMARGEFISIIESDDFIESEMYEEMYEYAKKTGADVVKTPYYEYCSDGTRTECTYRKFMRERVPQGMCFSMKEYGELLQVHASLWSGLYRTEYMRNKNIRFVNAKGGAYVDVGFRIDTLINTDRIAWLDKPYYNYRVDAVGSTTNNFNLSTMLKRWREVHEKFDCEDKNEAYTNFYGKHLILDEYLNSVGWLWMIDATEEEYRQISENLSYVSPQIIQGSDALNDRQKRELLKFKDDPESFKARAGRYRKTKRIQPTAENVMNIFADTRIFLWSAAGFCTMLLMLGFLYIYQKPVLGKGLEFIFQGSMLCFLLVMILCLGMKSIRKAYFILLEINDRRKEERKG